MKKLNSILFTCLAVLALHACQSKTKDSKEGADSLNAAKDSSTKQSASAQGIAVDKSDAEFAVEAANGGIAEVEMGNTAVHSAVNPRVKKFGEMMVTDHTQANNELKDLAKSKNIVLPASVSADEQKMEADISKKTGKDFDKAYVNSMVDDHKKDIKAFEDAIKTLKDPDLKAFAEKTLPVLKKHLDSINAIHASIK